MPGLTLTANAVRIGFSNVNEIQEFVQTIKVYRGDLILFREEWSLMPSQSWESAVSICRRRWSFRHIMATLMSLELRLRSLLDK